MHVLIAPDKFRGSLSAGQATAAIAEGVRRAVPDASLDCCPIADGGEGTREALLSAKGGELRETRVAGPLGADLDAGWALLADGTAVIESAAAAGLALVPEAARNPALTTSFGVGQLVRAALDAGSRRIIIAVGGTATNDGGAGLAQALGARFDPAPTPLCGAHLGAIERVDLSRLDPRLHQTELVAACDVNNPLFGAEGAALRYSPQKGASPEGARQLDAALQCLARAVARARPECEPLAPFMGAGGGLGFGLSALLGARPMSGADLVLDAVSFDARLPRAELVLTGEGRLDALTANGKAVLAVTTRAARARRPVIALVGAEAAAPEALWALGLTASFSICNEPLSLEVSSIEAAALLSSRAAHVARLWSTMASR